MNDTNRLTELESKYAFQDKMLQELSDVVFEQQNQIDDLNRIISNLQNRIIELSERVPQSIPAADEKPPHY